MLEDERDSFTKGNNRSIEEDWYRRTVETNIKDPHIFVYSVPFETSGEFVFDLVEDKMIGVVQYF